VTGRALIACEFSGAVRDAFLNLGYDAISCDTEPSETPGPHYQGDVRDILDDGFDMMIAFPPCRFLCYSGARWWAGRQSEQADAIDFVHELFAAPIPRMCVENPHGIISRTRKWTQVIQPYMFGHGETKATCLWLADLPPLQPTDPVAGREARIHRMGETKNRSRNRSRTYPGVAAAMAAQWGALLGEPLPEPGLSPLSSSSSTTGCGR